MAQCELRFMTDLLSPIVVDRKRYEQTMPTEPVTKAESNHFFLVFCGVFSAPGRGGGGG